MMSVAANLRIVCTITYVVDIAYSIHLCHIFPDIDQCSAGRHNAWIFVLIALTLTIHTNALVNLDIMETGCLFRYTSFFGCSSMAKTTLTHSRLREVVALLPTNVCLFERSIPFPLFHSSYSTSRLSQARDTNQIVIKNDSHMCWSFLRSISNILGRTIWLASWPERNEALVQSGVFEEERNYSQ